MIIWILKLPEKKKSGKKKKKELKNKRNTATVFPKIPFCPFWKEGVKIEAAH